MKRVKKMILLLGVLAVLLGGYAYMDRDIETSAVSEEEGAFELTAKTAAELTGLEWTANETTFSFARETDGWKKADQAAYPVAQETVEKLAEKLTALKADRRLDNVSNLNLYGLAEPAFTVTARWSDGSETVYQMGDPTPFGDGYYLALSTQPGAVYTVAMSLSSTFNKKMDDFAEMETIPSVAEVTRITVGDTLDASWQAESSTINASQHWYAADGRALDGVDTLVDDAQGIAWDGLVEAVASETQLAEWQLEAENAVALTLYDGAEIVSILLGAADENGDYYARLPQSAMVYTVSADSVSDLLAATPESLLSLTMVKTEYADLQQAVFSFGERTHTVVPPVQTEESEASEAAEDPNEMLWKQFIALKATEHVDMQPQGEKLLSVAVTADNGASAVFTFTEYNADSYLVTDGARVMLTAADSVDKLIRTLKSLG